MPLGFNSLSPAQYNKFYQWCGADPLRENIVRAQMNFQDFSLSSTDMDALNATPVTVLSAPGSGLVNVVDSIFLFVDAGATPFELGSGVLEFRYTDATGAKVITDVVNSVVESATDVYNFCPGIVALAVENAVICAHTSTDVTAGDGSIKGRIFYRTVRVSDLSL